MHTSIQGEVGGRGCPRVEACGLSAVLRSGIALMLWRSAYCGNAERFGECHRFRIAESGQPIPAEMLPNGQRVDPAPRS